MPHHDQPGELRTGRPADRARAKIKKSLHSQPQHIESAFPKSRSQFLHRPSSAKPCQWPQEQSRPGVGSREDQSAGPKAVPAFRERHRIGFPQGLVTGGAWDWARRSKSAGAEAFLCTTGVCGGLTPTRLYSAEMLAYASDPTEMPARVASRQQRSTFTIIGVRKHS